MKRLSILNKILSSGLIAVVRGDSPDAAISIVDSLISGGVHAIELTFTVPQADKVISKLNEKYADNDKVIIGAGTVLDQSSCQLALSSGAKFIVSPAFDKEVAKLCNLNQVPYIPGCATATEVIEALKYGSDIIKVFPGSVLSPKFISSLLGPLPQASFMPSGGVNYENMEAWLEAGAISLSIGSSLTKGSAEDIKKNAERYSKKYDELIRKYRQ